MLERRTKIVATLGPATDGEGVLDAARRGGDGLRAAQLLARHPRRPAPRAAAVRAIAERSGRPIALLVDLQGPKLRLGAGVESRAVGRGDGVAFVAARRRRGRSTSRSSSTSSPRS